MPQDSKNVLPADLQEAVQKVFLAGLGALAVAEQEGKRYFTKLVRRGERYDGPGREQVEELREQIEGHLGRLRQDVGAQAERARQAVDTQAGRARQAVDEAVEGLEGRLAELLTSAFQSLGIPTRTELDALEASVRQLAQNIDALREQRKGAAPSGTASPAAEAPGFEIRVRDAAEAGASGAGAVEATAVGGGWYEITAGGVVVEKVQGRAAAEAAVARLEAAQA